MTKGEEKMEAQIEEEMEAQIEEKMEVQTKIENSPRARRSKLRRRMRYKNYSPPSPNSSPQTPKKPTKTSNLISNISAMFKNIMNNSPNVLWGILLLFALQMTQSHAATIQQPSSQTVLASLQSSPHRTVYPLLKMETKTWAYNMGEVEDAAYSILDDACYYLAIADDQCTEHPSSFQATLLSSENFKKSMTKAFDTIYSLQRMCDVGHQPSSEHAINQCKKGEEWREQEFITKKFTFLDSMFDSFTPDFLNAEKTSHRGERSIQWSTAMEAISLFGPIILSSSFLAQMAAKNITMEKVLSRHPRFVVSGPILIGIAVGAGVIGTAGATAHFVAKEETSRVVEEVRAGRQLDICNNIQNSITNHNYTRIVAGELDIIRLTEAISTHSTVLLHDSEDLKQELSHLASKKDKLRYSSSFAEEYWTAIKELNSKHNIGITSSEVNFKTRV